MYLNLGEYENAIVALNQPLNNQVPEAIVLTGMCYEKMGEYDLALSFYSDHLKLAQDPNVMLRLGYVYAAQGEMTYALETFQQCLENLGDDRTNPVLYYNIAQIYIQQGEYEKALETAAEGNLAYPSDTSLRQTLADLQAYQNSTG